MSPRLAHPRGELLSGNPPPGVIPGLSADRTGPGESARIAYITTAHHPRLHKLLSFGVSPGSVVKIHQKFPSLIIQSEQTELALEEAVARDIFVRRDR